MKDFSVTVVDRIVQFAFDKDSRKDSVFKLWTARTDTGVRHKMTLP